MGVVKAAQTRTVSANFIGGVWSPAATDSSYEKRGPWQPTEVIGEFALSNPQDVAAAVDAAARAFPAWEALSIVRRASYLAEAANALERRREKVAREMTLEMGKPLREAQLEVGRTVAIFRYYASEAFRPFGERYQQQITGGEVSTRRRAVGVAGLITPWNFPCAIPAWKLAPALVYGNTVVLKLAMEAPGSGLHIAHSFEEADLPPGVLNVITGSGSTVGAALVEHPDVPLISFTGSLPVGQEIREKVAQLGKRVQLELGGQNPLIVLADADLARAAEAAFAGAFWSAGQKCTATRRIFVEATVYEPFREFLLARIENGRVGDPLDLGTEVGPIVSESQLEDVIRAISRGTDEGGVIVAGGERLDQNAYLFSPTVFEDVLDDAFLSREEVFGPVMSLYSVSDLEEAIERANRVRFGLSAGIFTSSLAAATKFERTAQAGVLHVNSSTAGVEFHAPFGGIKGSGYGPHEQGRAALDFYTDLVTVYVDS
jgi:aldehyde dehydrogenase (NAD+)